MRRVEIMDRREILEIVGKAISEGETVDYYATTENSPEGWHKIEPYNFSVRTEIISKALEYDKDEISPGHILNTRTIGFGDTNPHSFIMGKIQKSQINEKKDD